MRAFRKISFVFALSLVPVLVAAQQDFAWQKLGDETYAAQCATCHQQDGSGVEGVYPSLVGSELLTGDPEQVINLVLNGQAAMPAFAKVLNDEQIAAVISHERNSWGNEASVVTPDMVSAQRTAGSSAGAGETASAATGGLASGGPASGGATMGAASDVATTEMATVELLEGWHDQAAQLFSNNCAACHQAKGQGVKGAFPALAGNAYVMSDPTSLTALILHGRGGMPSFESGLTSEEIAYILSYVRNSWGNEASLISTEMVEDVVQGRLSPSDPNDPNYRPGAAN